MEQKKRKKTIIVRKETGRIKAKAYLLQIRDLEKSLDVLMQSQQHAFDLATSTTTNPDKIRIDRTNSTKRIEEIYAEISADIDLQLAELLTVRLDVQKTIRQLKRANHRRILTLYYIDGYTWPQVADFEGKEVRTINRWHGRALQEVQSIIDRRNEKQ